MGAWIQAPLAPIPFFRTDRDDLFNKAVCEYECAGKIILARF